MLTLYRPFTSLLRDEFLGDRAASAWVNPWREARDFNPAVDIVEKDNAYVLNAELPGLAPENIDVQVENDVLTVRGERKYVKEEENAGYRRVERSYGSFTRSFALPKGTNPEAIDAQIENGVLTVTIPKAVAASARKVEVKSAGLIEKAKKIFSKAADAPSATPQS